MLIDSTHYALSRTRLAQSRLFREVPDALLDRMMRDFHYERWSRREAPLKARIDACFYILVSGRLEVVHTHPETGRSVTLYLLNLGDGFDLITLLDNKPHKMSLVPNGEVEVLSVAIGTMRSWLWKYPELNRNFMPYLAARMREQEDMTASVALYDTVSRLSRLILKHATLNRDYLGEKDEAHKSHLLNGFSDEMLARMIGSVRQVVNKHLQFWQRAGLLSKHRHTIEINNLKSLEQAACDFLDDMKKSA